MSFESNFMKDPEDNILWEKIQHFNFDKTGSVIKFADKLGAQNNWTPKFTERVIDEYRRFIFLCCISPTGASPSQTVDEAWHLHLTYTQSYWTDLCRNTLGMDLHHYPSKGGEEEKHKHEKWYNETLWLYEQVFGAAPPSDIWPRPKEAAVKIDVPDLSPGIFRKLLVILLLFLPFIFIIQTYNVVFPFSLNGPQFLVFYALLGIAAAISFNIIYKHKAEKLRSVIQSHFPNDVSAFQLAEFLHGKDRAVQTGIIDLVRKGLLKVEENKKLRINNSNSLPDKQSPFVVSFADEDHDKEVSYKEIAGKWYRKENCAHPVLEGIKELVNKNYFHKFYLPAGVLLVGIARLTQGFISDKPVFYLILEMIAFILVMWVIAEQCSRHKVVSEEAEAAYQHKLKSSGQQHDEVVTNFAMNGNRAITGLAEGALLSSIFFVALTSFQNADSGSDGGTGCGSDGGCGGGCGGCGGG